MSTLRPHPREADAASITSSRRTYIPPRRFWNAPKPTSSNLPVISSRASIVSTTSTTLELDAAPTNRLPTVRESFALSLIGRPGTQKVKNFLAKRRGGRMFYRSNDHEVQSSRTEKKPMKFFSTPPTRMGLFAKLAQKVRLRIWELALAYEDRFVINNFRGDGKLSYTPAMKTRHDRRGAAGKYVRHGNGATFVQGHNPLGLLRTCASIRREAKGVFYAVNDFEISHEPRVAGCDAATVLGRWRGQIGDRCFAAVRRIEFQICHSAASAAHTMEQLETSLLESIWAVITTAMTACLPHQHLALNMQLVLDCGGEALAASQVSAATKYAAQELKEANVRPLPTAEGLAYPNRIVFPAATTPANPEQRGTLRALFADNCEIVKSKPPYEGYTPRYAMRRDTLHAAGMLTGCQRTNVYFEFDLNELMIGGKRSRKEWESQLADETARAERERSSWWTGREGKKRRFGSAKDVGEAMEGIEKREAVLSAIAVLGKVGDVIRRERGESGRGSWGALKSVVGKGTKGY